MLTVRPGRAGPTQGGDSMAVPKYVALGKVSNGGFDLSGAKGDEIVEASQTDHTNIALGNGNDTLFAGDSDLSSLGSGTDRYYGARDSAVTAGTGVDTFIYGVSSKPQSVSMLGTQSIYGYDTSKDSIQLSSSLVTQSQLAADFMGASHFPASGGNGIEVYIPLDGSDGLDIVTKGGGHQNLKQTLKAVEDSIKIV